MEENKEKTVKKRQECDPAYQWHIQDLYASDEAWEKDYESLTSEILKYLWSICVKKKRL